MNSKESAKEGDSMLNQLVQSGSSTGQGCPLRKSKCASRGISRDKLTLIERMSIQEENLEVLRQEMMNQFQQLHQMLRVVQQSIVAAMPTSQPTQQTIRTPNVWNEVQGTARVANDYLPGQGHGIRLSEQRDDVTHEGIGMEYQQGEQLEQTLAAKWERTMGKQLEQTTKSQSTAKGKHFKQASKKESDKESEESDKESEESDKESDKESEESDKESDKDDLVFFHQLNPPTFAGGDSVAAENWLDAMDKTFDFLNCSDAQRVCFATYQLLDDAYQWWETQKRIFESKDVKITWGKFKEAFYEKFFPSTFWVEKALEFAELRQGTMSVAQYETQFFALLRYAPDFIVNDEARRQKFEDGLADGIQARVMSFGCQTFRQAVDKAMLVERDLEATLNFLEKRMGSAEREESSAKRQKVQNFGQGSRCKGSKLKKLRKPPKKCDKCKRFHSGQCNYQHGVCHKCGQMGHLAIYCTIGYVCYRCGKVGHLSKHCQTPSASGQQ